MSISTCLQKGYLFYNQAGTWHISRFAGKRHLLEFKFVMPLLTFNGHFMVEIMPAQPLAV